MTKKNVITNQNSSSVLYIGTNGSIEFRADTDKETIWATQAQITELFEIDRTVVTKHINNILKDNEIEEKSNVQKMHIPNSDKPISLYSLDIILAVGYRTNSAKAIKFRQWATKTLREYLLKGYSLDSRKLKIETERFKDLRDAIQFIESKEQGKVKGKLTLKLTKEII